jgi:hypothetical protein
METRRRAVIKWSLVVGITIIGVTGIVLFHQMPALRNWNWAETFLSLCDALAIAGILGITVEGALRSGLVRRVSAEATAVLWGVNAPQEYIDGLRDSLGDIKLVALSTEWELELDWVNQDPASGLLRVKSTLRSRAQNIATKPASFSDPWLAHSADHAADLHLRSGFLDYMCSAAEQPVGRRDSNERSQRWRPNELQDSRVSQICDDGSVQLKRDALPRIDKVRYIRPGGIGRVEAVGETFQPPTGGLPLVGRIPSIASSLKISGSAAAEGQLEIEVYQPAKANEPVRSRRRRGKLEWDFGFSLPGSTVRVEWQSVNQASNSAVDQIAQELTNELPESEQVAPDP